MNRINLLHPFPGEEMKAQKTGSHDCNSGKKNGSLKPVLQMNPLYIVF